MPRHGDRALCLHGLELDTRDSRCRSGTASSIRTGPRCADRDAGATEARHHRVTAASEAQSGGTQSAPEAAKPVRNQGTNPEDCCHASSMTMLSAAMA